MPAPIVAEVVRNGVVESRHHGAVVALTATGQVAFSTGDVDSPMFPRSCAKPLQTLGMLRAGWNPADDRHITLACASHSGEPAHIDVVRRILAGAGLTEDDLDNTADLPLDVTAARNLVRAGEQPRRLFQNCSGKHAAMLATCVGNGWPTAGYRDPAHPVQVAIRAAVEDLTAEAVAAVAVDGCGAPLFAMSLTGLARAFAHIAAADEGSLERRVADAVRTHPFLLGGSGRDVTALLEAVPGIVTKDGAEGVYAAGMPDGRAIALKIEDGAGRARQPVMTAALRRLGVNDAALAELEITPVLGHGQPVGEVRSVAFA